MEVNEKKKSWIERNRKKNVIKILISDIVKLDFTFAHSFFKKVEK